MDRLSALILSIASLVLFAWLLGVVVSVIKLIVKKKKINKKETLIFADIIKEKPVVSSLVAVGILALVLYHSGVFTEIIGIQKPLSKRGNGDYCYYVEAIELESGKEYTIPAKISVDGGNYYVEQLFFDDGRVVEFENYDDGSFKSYSRTYDTLGNEWKYRLTEEHAYSPSFQETSSINTTNIIFEGLFVFAILYNWLGGLAYAIQSKKEGA